MNRWRARRARKCAEGVLMWRGFPSETWLEAVPRSRLEQPGWREQHLWAPRERALMRERGLA